MMAQLGQLIDGEECALIPARFNLKLCGGVKSVGYYHEWRQTIYFDVIVFVLPLGVC